jgi:hypothetical protein
MQMRKKGASPLARGGGVNREQESRNVNTCLGEQKNMRTSGKGYRKEGRGGDHDFEQSADSSEYREAEETVEEFADEIEQDRDSPADQIHRQGGDDFGRGPDRSWKSWDGYENQKSRYGSAAHRIAAQSSNAVVSKIAEGTRKARRKADQAMDKAVEKGFDGLAKIDEILSGDEDD